MTIENTLQLERMNILLPDGTKVNEPKLGDIFTFSIKEGEYMFGRIIAENPTVDGFNDPKIKKVVIYIYKNIEHSKKVDISKLTVDSLLLPPLILNIDVWKLGYLEIIDHEETNDVNVHFPICFDNKGLYGIDYTDPWGKKIEKQKICGLAGLSNMVVLESKLCNIFGFSMGDPSDKKEITNTIELKTKPERMRIIHDNPNEVDPKAGDIFVFSVNENEFRFGRVVADKVSSGPNDTSNIYIAIDKSQLTTLTTEIYL